MEDGKEEENKFNKVKKCKAIRIKDFRGRGYQGRIERDNIGRRRPMKYQTPEIKRKYIQCVALY